MKYLERFYNYIKEGSTIGISSEDIEDLLLPIKDIGFNYGVSEGIVISADPNNKNNGRKYLSINIPLSKSKTSELITNYKHDFIDDNNFWDLLDEIVTLRNRVLNMGLENCTIDFSNKRNGGYSPYIYILLIGDKDTSKEGDMNLIELEKRITSKLNSMRSDFSYGTYCKLQDDYIFIKSDGFGYTHRKLTNLLNRSIEGSNLSLSDFNIEKSQNKDTGDWFIKITTKE